MDGTTKTVLIVGAAAVAAFILLRALAPQPVRPTGPTVGGVSVNGILDFGAQAFGAVRGIFASASSSAPAEIDGTSTDDFQAGHFGVDYSRE